mmetsp:Transcript_18027/g.30294  ORF Transcript_18027/g.30294 Transcript_18027/m.30294 type:complete len:195 (-) Transcript_18027:294-878(-)
MNDTYGSSAGDGKFGSGSYGSLGAIPDVGNIDINKISKKGGPDYIQHSNRGRDPFARLSFNTGIFWLGGFLGGGAYGFVEGWRSASSPNYKIRFNSVMNAFSKRGSAVGNSLGIIAFLHTTSVAILDLAEVERYINTPVTTPALAGMMTGVIYKSTRGPRAAALAGAIGGGISCVYWFGGSFLYNRVLGRGGRF